MSKKIKIQFAPGCFDNFEGTQEELDGLIEEITRMAESGELMEQAQPVDLTDEADIELLSGFLFDELETAQRKLQ